MSGKLDRLEKKIKAANRQEEPSSIRASSMELEMYFRCLEEDWPMPEAGSDEFWELFDLLNEAGPEMNRCSRELMEQYIRQPPKEIKTPPEVANDPAVKELERYIEERQQKEKTDHRPPLGIELAEAWMDEED